MYIAHQPDRPWTFFEPIRGGDGGWTEYKDTSTWDIQLFNASADGTLTIAQPDWQEGLTFVCYPPLPIILPRNRMATLRQTLRIVSGSDLTEIQANVECFLHISADTTGM
jgi:hypothetical protein